MNFNITYDSSVTSQSASFQAQFMGAVNAAVQFLEHAFTNNITVNVTFAWGALGGGAAAENSFYYNTYSYSQIKTALTNSGKSADDLTAYATLPSTDPTGTGHSYGLTVAQARALGFAASAPYDDFVTLGSNLSWTFDPNNRAVAGEYDAIGALEHELTEGIFGRIGSLGSNSAGLGAGIYTPLDLFRYSSPGVRNFSTSAADYFSIDGQHLLTEFNINSQFGGDVSDWYPTIRGDSFGDAYSGTVGQVTPTDIRELDILGWNRAPTITSDINGDFVSDVVWNNPSTGNVAYWQMNGGQGPWQTAGNVNTGWQPVGLGDFAGSGYSDILYYSSTMGALGYYGVPNGQTVWQGLGAVDKTWAVAGVGDFNGTGSDDILLYNSSIGAIGYLGVQSGSQTTWQGLGAVDKTWKVAGIGDFNGNGKDDVLLYNASIGALGFLSVQNGNQTAWQGIGSVSTAWKPVGVGDFNGDGTSDILFDNPTLSSLGYLGMQNGQGTWHGIGGIDPSLTVAAVADYNGDGTSDILLYNSTSGATSYLAMQNGSGTSHTIGSVATTWKIVA